jgi:MFS family permease
VEGRDVRTRSLMALPEAEEYPAGPLMALLGAVSFAEGMDAVLFGAAAYTLEKKEDFDVSALGWLAFVQLLCQAIAGPVWGILSSRGILTRKVILAQGTFFQGLATLLMWISLDVRVMCALRALNGVMLASLRPIANSIVGDRFDDTVRGAKFGIIMMSMLAGTSVYGIFAGSIADKELFPTMLPGFLGWKVSFIVCGVFTCALAPLILMFLQAPPVLPSASTKSGGESEWATLKRLLSRWTFAGMVFQGMFGLIPWRAFDFRIYFYSAAGMSSFSASLVNSLGGAAGAVGSNLGGYIGDALSKCWPLNGRILNAQLSVFGGIPIAFFTFMVAAPEAWAFTYHLVLAVSLGLVATWTSAGTNSPVLCTLADDSERALILASQTSLEGAVGALGPMMFTYLLTNVFGVPEECKDNPDFPGCNQESAGKALFWTSCVPWFFCGLIYSSLHCSYRRDLEALLAEREAKKEQELTATMM